MTAKNSFFETPRRGQINLNAQEVFLLSDTDAELKWRSRDRTLRIAATFALFLTSLTTSQSLLKDSDGLFNLFKQDGPYDSAELTIADQFEEAFTPAEPTDDALYLADTFNGLLGTSGYNVVFDAGVLESSLEANQSAIFMLEQKRPRDDSYIRSGTMILGSGDDPLLKDIDAYDDIDVRIPNRHAMIGDGTAWNGEIMGVKPDTYYMTEDGIALEMIGPAIATVTIVESDTEELTVVSSKSTTVEIVPNAECEDGNEFTTEAALTPEQFDVVCDMFNQYEKLIAGDFSVHLDSISYDSEAQDSVNYPSSSIRMTYPYIGDKEVSEMDLKRTFLHEVMHTAYDSALGDLGFFVNSAFSFKAISANTVYKMPPHSEVNTFAANPADVEPIWAIITESSYIGDDSRHGHPWDNPSEMMSSTAAVLAYYPDEFVANYKELAPMQQFAIRNTVGVTKGLIERYGVDITEIVPEWEEISATLGL